MVLVDTVCLIAGSEHLIGDRDDERTQQLRACEVQGFLAELGSSHKTCSRLSALTLPNPDMRLTRSNIRQVPPAEAPGIILAHRDKLPRLRLVALPSYAQSGP